MLHVYIQLYKFQAQKSHLFIYRIEILVKIRKNCGAGNPAATHCSVILSMPHPHAVPQSLTTLLLVVFEIVEIP